MKPSSFQGPVTGRELENLVLLNRLFRGGTRLIQPLLAAGLLPSEIMMRIARENFANKAGLLEKTRAEFSPEKEIDSCDKLGIFLMDYFHPDYPGLLKLIPDPPMLLYVRGHLLATDGAAVAMVGARHASYYGREQARRFASQLVSSGLTVVSGLARGIDQAAHEGALSVSYGRTLAVLGCGLDRVYPPENRALAERIGEQGALLSEYPLGTLPLAANFPCRNRIIAGLSLGVFVVEAHTRSGSLITAREALEQGRDVFALPGPVDQLTSKGTHQLLKEGAFLADSPSDILEVLAPALRRFLPGLTFGQPANVLGEAEDRPPEVEGEVKTELQSQTWKEGDWLLKALSDGPLTYDELAEKHPAGGGVIPSLLMELELKKRIRKVPDGRFSLC